MDPVTARAFFEELSKIAQSGSEIGKLIFPSTDDGVPPRSERDGNVAPAADANDATPHPEEQYA